MSIKINDTFEFERYAHGWELHEWRDGKDKDGKPKKSKKTTYHSSLEHLCRVMIDKSAGNADTAGDILCAIETATSDILTAVADIPNRLKPSMETTESDKERLP